MGHLAPLGTFSVNCAAILNPCVSLCASRRLVGPRLFVAQLLAYDFLRILPWDRRQWRPHRARSGTGRLSERQTTNNFLVTHIARSSPHVALPRIRHIAPRGSVCLLHVHAVSLQTYVRTAPIECIHALTPVSFAKFRIYLHLILIGRGNRCCEHF